MNSNIWGLGCLFLTEVYVKDKKKYQFETKGRSKRLIFEIIITKIAGEEAAGRIGICTLK